VWQRRLISAVLAILACVWLPLPGSAQAADEYIIGPNDVLTITVFASPELTNRYVVQTDGTFTFPLLGSVKAGGRSLQALEMEIRDRLGKGYLKNPQVGIAVEQYRSQRVFVMGEVRQPGGFEFTGVMTVVEALARAGSTTERASLEASVVRATPGSRPNQAAAAPGATTPLPNAPNSQVITVDLERLAKGDLSQNVTLMAGDTVFVPRADTVFVSGQVQTPGEVIIRKGMTVRQVLALAGGVTDRGSTGRIQVIRRVDGKDVTTAIQLQDLAQPGDTIIVRERFF
jgi:polysaccharide export outer membrane protein